MCRRPIRSLGALTLAVSLGFTLVGCGGSDEEPSSPSPAAPDVAGPYSVTWTLQVLRRSDGFQTSFDCSGQLTLVQGPTQREVASLSGFAVAGSPCAPESWDLAGTVRAGGAIEFSTNAPPPTEGPCPGGENVHFSGQVTLQDGWASLSVRGVTEVTCPQFGAHEFTYLIRGWK